jgi:hypothetical protein
MALQGDGEWHAVVAKRRSPCCLQSGLLLAPKDFSPEMVRRLTENEHD